MGDLTQPQREAAMAVLKAALSPEGYEKVQQIVQADEVLKGGDGGGRGGPGGGPGGPGGPGGRGGPEVPEADVAAAPTSDATTITFPFWDSPPRPIRG